MCLFSPQILQRQGAQLLAQTLSRTCFRQWRQQVEAVEPLSPPLPTTPPVTSLHCQLSSTCDLYKAKSFQSRFYSATLKEYVRGISKN